MPGAHRNGDSRFCGASTIATNKGVYVNGQPWALDGDPSTHGAGLLSSVVGSSVRIGGTRVIVAVGDVAGGDLALHPAPPTDPAGHSGNVFAYG